jgi:hypothetical protein
VEQPLIQSYNEHSLLATQSKDYNINSYDLYVHKGSEIPSFGLIGMVFMSRDDNGEEVSHSTLPPQTE